MLILRSPKLTKKQYGDSQKWQSAARDDEGRGTSNKRRVKKTN
jgi:hypothetical protein